MPFAFSRRGTKTGVLAVFFGVFCAGILLWVLLGEFDVLGLGYVHAEGQSTGRCYDTSTAPNYVQVACSTDPNVMVLNYGSSLLAWPFGLAMSLVLAWSLALPLALRMAGLTSERTIAYSVATGALVAAVGLTGAVPTAASGWLVFARVAAIVGAAALFFFAANFCVNRYTLASKNAQAAYEQMVADAERERKERSERKKERPEDPDYVQDVKN